MPGFKTKFLRHLIVILLSAFLFSFSAYAAVQIQIDSTGTPAYSKSDINFGNMTPLYPDNFKEDNTVKTPHGAYSHRIIFENDMHHVNGPANLEFQVSGSLFSGGDTIPIDNLMYLFTWTNGSGEVYNYKNPGGYQPIPTSFDNLYSSEVTENGKDVEIQLKYALQIPADQAPGTYTGARIDFNMYDPDLGGSISSDFVNVSVTVLPIFQLSIDRGIVDFENMLPGQRKDNVPVEGIIVTTKTNNGNPWYLKISNDSFLSSGPDVIPNNNFMWYGWSDGVGRWHGTGEDTFSLTPKLVYSSGPGESSNMPDGTYNHFKFKLNIPQKQKPGKYISIIRFTATE